MTGVRGSITSSIFILLAMGGVVLVLRPAFLFGSLGGPHYLGHWGQNGYIPAH